MVTAHHLVYDDDSQNFIYVKDHKDAVLTDKGPDELTCLVTENHTIPIGRHVFHDWEDNQRC